MQHVAEMARSFVCKVLLRLYGIAFVAAEPDLGSMFRRLTLLSQFLIDCVSSASQSHKCSERALLIFLCYIYLCYVPCQ